MVTTSCTKTFQTIVQRHNKSRLLPPQLLPSILTSAVTSFEHSSPRAYFATNSDSNPTKLTYQGKKDLRKQRRTELYEKKIENQTRRLTRRQHAPKNMLKNEFNAWFLKRKAYQEIQNRLAKRANKPWKVKVACVVERLPVVTPDKEKWETDFMEVQAYLSQFARTFPADTPFGPPAESDLPPGFKHPITEEDVLALLPENFQPAPRVTEADHTNDTKSLERKLPQRIFLTIRDTAGAGKDGVVVPNNNVNDNDNSKVWTFPTTVANKDETLLETAKRISKETFGDNLDIFSVGNCPMAADLLVYNEDTHPEKDLYFGEKIFYFKVQRLGGDVDPHAFSPEKDYAWLSKEEIVEKVIQERGFGVARLHHYLL